MVSEYQTQNELVLEMLQARGERGLTTLEAIPEIGSTRLAARVHDLREKGYDIRCDRIRTARGKRVGRYVLVAPVKVEYVEQELWA